MTMTRRIHKIDQPVSAIGMGCWAIGGPFWLDGKADGWGQVDDEESARAIHKALDMGVNFFDTSDAYGAGHSERVLGRVLADQREQVVIATKFGFIYDEDKKTVGGTNVTPEYARWACEQSLQRLNTDYIDLYQLHCGASPQEAEALFDALDTLVKEGKIRAYGWSTGDVASARLLAERENGVAIQHGLNVLDGTPEILDVCAAYDVMSVTNSPLANGLLSGKYGPGFVFPEDDFRGAGHVWATSFVDGRPRPELLQQLDAIREILTADGRTLVQGALAWVWARSERTIPIPGIRTEKQAAENAAAMQYGPLTATQMAEIERVLQRDKALS
ncbi:aldo/keto reductase [Phototrophicus methaneseepsis]|nr:aldo/keto reductase [Phototrophicus methaneseepsis]